MKMHIPKLLTLTFLLLLQKNLSAQNTPEEHIYVTKGLKLQQEAGLDGKKGYRLSPISTYKDKIEGNTIQFDFYHLLRSGGTLYLKKGIVVKRSYKGSTDYLLIPAAGTSQALTEKMQQELGIHTQMDWVAGSGFEHYLLCFGRAMVYLSSQLQEKMDLTTR